MLAYLVLEDNKTSQTRKIRKIITKTTKKKAGRSSEECDARSARLQEESTQVIPAEYNILVAN